jgi:prepilin-type N-terminal cleavage/methylation domain-containing protein/prepilin-type processing-associated H-X9-DG protein
MKTTVRAFTLIELLTVIIIIGILAGIMIPAVGKVREKGRQAQCASNLRQVHMGIMLWTTDHKDIITPNLEKSTAGHLLSPDPTWVIAIIPYLGDKAARARTGKRPIGILACPASDNLVTSGAHADYAKNYASSGNRLSLIGQPSRIILAGDGALDGDTCNRDIGSWMGPPAWGLEARHGNRANFVYIDGHIQSLELDASLIGNNADKKLP